PVTPPSMKLLDKRNPFNPIAADRMPRTTNSALSASRRVCVITATGSLRPARGNSRLASGAEQVRAGADNRRLRFQAPRDVQQVVPQPRIFPPLVEVAQPLPQSLDAQHLHRVETGPFQLHAKILGPMKVRGREVVEQAGRVAVLAGGQILIANLDEARIEVQLLHQARERRRVARDRGGGDDTLR